MFQTFVVTANDTRKEPFVDWSPDWPIRDSRSTNILVMVHRQVGISKEGMRNFAPTYKNHGFICQRKAQIHEPETTPTVLPIDVTSMSGDAIYYDLDTNSGTGPLFQRLLFRSSTSTVGKYSPSSFVLGTVIRNNDNYQKEMLG